MAKRTYQELEEIVNFYEDEDNSKQSFKSSDLEIYNDVFGISFEPRDGSWNGKDKHVCIQLYSGDDESYRTMGGSYSSFWLDSMIKILQDAKQRLETDSRFKKDGQWGYKFK